MRAERQKSFPHSTFLPKRFGGLLCLFGCVLVWFLFSPIASAKEGVPVIPAGQEALIEKSFTPRDGLLPEGVKLESLHLNGGIVELSFQFQRQAWRFHAIPKGFESGDCREGGAVSFCSAKGDWPVWMATYRHWFVTNGNDKLAIAAWGKIEREKDKRVPEKSYYEQVDAPLIVSLFFFTLAFGFLSLLYRFKRKETDSAWAYALAIIGFLTIAVFYLTPLTSVTLKILLFVTAFIMALVALLLARVRAGRLPAWRECLSSLMEAKAWIVALMVLFLALSRISALGTLRKLLMFLHDQITSTPSFHAFVTNFSMILSITLWIVSLLYVLRSKRIKRKRNWLLGGVALAHAIGGGLLVASYNYSQEGAFLDVEIVWSELKTTFLLLEGRTTSTNQVLGIAFLTSIPFRLFGVSAETFALIRSLYAVLACLGLAIAARLIWRSWLPALIIGVFFPIWPFMPVTAIEGWWFFLGVFAMALSAGLFVKAARVEDDKLFILAAITAHIAFTIRPEALVIFVFAYVAEALYRFPNLRYLKIFSWLFSFHLFHLILLFIYESPVEQDILTANAEGYAFFLKLVFPFLLLIAFSSFFQEKRLRKEGVLIAFWFLGMAGFYLIVDTVPSYIEAFVMFAPGFLLPAGLLNSTPDASFVKKAIRLVFVFSLIFLLSHLCADTKEKYEALQREKVQTALCIHDIHLQKGYSKPVLFEPAHLKLIRPHQKPFDEKWLTPYPEDLAAYVASNKGAICFSPKEKPGQCCYFELRYHNIDKYDKGTCWPYEKYALVSESIDTSCGVNMIHLKANMD